MNILITGHTGFLGKELVSLLSKTKSNNLYGVSRSLSGNFEGKSEYPLNIIDKETLTKIISEKNIEVVVHLVGKSTVKDCEKDPYGAFITNSLGTASLLEACRLNDIKKVISVETDKVYGLQKEEMIDENSNFNPQSPYEFSKVFAADFANIYRKYYNMNIISVRPVNLIGGNDPNISRILPRSFRSIMQNKPIPLYENAVTSYREFVYVKDVAKILQTLIFKDPKSKVYNISPGECVNIKDFLYKILSIAGCNIEPSIVKKEIEFNEIPYQSIDGSKFINEFNFKYTDLDFILKESYQDFQQLNLVT